MAAMIKLAMAHAAIPLIENNGSFQLPILKIGTFASCKACKSSNWLLSAVEVVWLAPAEADSMAEELLILEETGVEEEVLLSDEEPEPEEDANGWEETGRLEEMGLLEALGRLDELGLEGGREEETPPTPPPPLLFPPPVPALEEGFWLLVAPLLGAGLEDWL